jgi:hypothetical protein
VREATDRLRRPKDPEKPIAWLWKFVVCRAVGYGESMSICPVWCAGQVLRAPHNHSASLRREVARFEWMRGLEVRLMS